MAGGDGAVGPHGVYPVSTSGTAGGICVPDQDWDQDGQNLGGQGEQRQAPGLEPVPRLPWPWGWSPIRQYVPASPCLCLSISLFFVKLELYEVPRVPRKEAMLMLEQVDQARGAGNDGSGGGVDEQDGGN